MSAYCYLIITILFFCVSLAQAEDDLESLIQERMPAVPKFVLGYNEGWFGNHFGSGLTSNFKSSYVDEVFKSIKAAGGDVVRVWLFEKEQGIKLGQHTPQSRGVDSQMLINISKILDIARKRKVFVYITLFDGNDMPSGRSPQRDYYFNLLNNKFGEADAFRRNVLKPVLHVLNKHRDVIYGLDLMNEIEATLVRFYWVNTWHSPRGWMQGMRQYIKAYSPWLKVTTSSGWHISYVTIPSGFFSGLGLDFYDMHLYADNNLEVLPLGSICNRARKDNVPIILGEFGQLSKRQDDGLQERTTRMFLSIVRGSCFSGALAWRFDKSENWWNYQRADGSLRPAGKLMQSFKSLLNQEEQAVTE